VTALTEYARCPRRFKLKFIDGHPGLGEGMAVGMQIGTLVHAALEHNIIEIDALLPFADTTVEKETLTEAMAIARQFFQLTTYKFFRDTAIKKERRITLQLGKITFNGIIDLVGHNWVLDYKSDRTMQPQDHRFQLWTYARALERPEAHIAYLRHNYIHTFSSQDLDAIAPEIDILVEQLEAGNYAATPTMEKCAFCPYIPFCDRAAI
jgi:ATP-dependent helicase/nuclease subunit A